MKLNLSVALLFGALAWAGCDGSKSMQSPAPVPPSAKPAAGSGAPASANLLFRSHFVGTQKLEEVAKATRFETIRDLPVTVAMREQFLAKASLAAAGMLSGRAANTNDAALMRPLLEDLLAGESVVEGHGAEGDRLGWSLAVGLNKERVTLWETNLWQLTVGEGTVPTTLNVNGFNGWARLGTNGMLHFLRAGNWVLVGREKDPSGWMGLANQIKANGRPDAGVRGAWVSVEANLPELAKRLGLTAPMKLPQVSLSGTGKGEYLRTEGKLRFGQMLTLKLESWNIPTNTIRETAEEPLVSFTAVQGIEGWLGAQAWWQGLGAKSTPNQFYGWAHSRVPFMTSFAAPMNQASNELNRLAVPAANLAIKLLQGRYVGSPVFNTNRAMLAWQGMPVVVPFVKPAPEPAGNHLVGGFFPVDSPDLMSAPSELLGQVQGRKNLVYYDWEITEARVAQWHQLLQVFQIAELATPDLETGPAQKWLLGVAPQLGNAITEVTVASPTELAFTRRSHLGLTGIELALLSRWLDGAEFPRLSGATGGAAVVKPTPAP